MALSIAFSSDVIDQRWLTAAAVGDMDKDVEGAVKLGRKGMTGE